MAAAYIDKEIILIALKSILNTLEAYIDTEEKSIFYEELLNLKEETYNFIQEINTSEGQYMTDISEVVNKYSEIDNQYLRLIFSVRDEKLNKIEEEKEKQIIDQETEEDKVEEEAKEVIDAQDEIGEAPEELEKVIEKPQETKRVLIISEKDSKVYLPYSKEEIDDLLNQGTYKTAEDAIREEFTIDLDKFKNPLKSRFLEAYILSKDVAHQSRMESLRLGFELMTKYNLHPAIIAACRNIDELDIYLDCLDEDELDKFDVFDIKFEIAPMIQIDDGTKRRRRAV